MPRRRQRSEQMYSFRAKGRRLHEHNCGLLQLLPLSCRTNYKELTSLKKMHKASKKLHVKAKTSPKTIIPHNQKVLLGASYKFWSLKESFGQIVALNRFKLSSTLSSDTILKNSPKQTISFLSGHQSSTKYFITSAKNKLKRTLLRPLAQVSASDIPYRNVHVALMFGPLLVENGIRKYVSLLTINIYKAKI